MSHGPLASLSKRNYRALTSNTKFAPAVADLARETGALRAATA